MGENFAFVTTGSAIPDEWHNDWQLLRHNFHS